MLGPTAASLDLVALEASAARVITALAGDGARVREDQLAAVAALVLERRRALVVQATGWGKSAVYWIAARALRDAGEGPVLVVSPLLALMRDQVAAAARAGLRAETLSSANFDDWRAVEQDVLGGHVDVLLVSPERLANPRFAATVLEPLLPRLGMLVIDEAHCISSWGHDFRPDYQRIARLLLERPGLPVLATTATANARVTADVAAQLGHDTLVLRGRLARESLQLSVVPGLTPLQRYAWVDAALSRLPGSGIVYVLTVAESERLAGFLASRGHRVAAYSGQLDPGERLKVEDALRDNELKAVVATSALGMGYDKPDLAFCLHVGSPASPVDYYQQVGRAGRALDTAVVALLPGSADEPIWEYFATASIPDPDQAAQVLDALVLAGGPVTVPMLESTTRIRRTRLELLVKVLAVDGAVERTPDGWAATGQAWTYDHEKYAALRTARRAEADLMRTYAAGGDCLDAVLRRSLDDELAPDYRCGRCSVCRDELPGGLVVDVDDAVVSAARDHLRGLDVVLEPRQLWASGMTGRRGRIGSLMLGPGRAVAFADDVAWPDAAALVADGTPDTDPPAWLQDAVVEVLRRWAQRWEDRPTLVVPVPSRTRPRLVRGLAAHVAEVGRLPLLEALTQAGPRAGTGLAPAARARALEPTLAITSAVPQGAAVLLVDDVWVTGWTATITGALLREAGAAAVLPLVVQQRP